MFGRSATPSEKIVDFYRKKLANGLSRFESIITGFGLKFTIDHGGEMERYIGLMQIKLPY